MTEVTSETSERKRIPSKPAALKHVASRLAGTLKAGDLYETTGLSCGDLTSAEIRRLEWAAGTVRDRLLRMGSTPEESGE